MKKKALLCCFSLCIFLVTVTAVKHLKDIRDLKNKTNFGKKFPRHGLMLLYWFARSVTIDQNLGILHNFSPDYYHFYGNQDRNPQQTLAFPVLSRSDNRVYYSLGRLRRNNPFPSYVTQDWLNNQNQRMQANVDRIVIRAQRNNPERVDEVYITQHYEDINQGSAYDPDNTFSVDESLLRQIRDLNSETDTCNENDPRQSFSNCDLILLQQDVERLQASYGDPDLALFMVLAGYDISSRNPPFCNPSGTRQSRSLDKKFKCEAYNNIKLEVKSSEGGYARISWSRIPENILRMKSNIGLYKDEQSLTVYPLKGKTYGTIDTNWSLNPGLQVKLTVDDKVIWAGPEFNDASGVLPTNIIGYDFSLQLYTKDGYACARLFIKNSFYNWKTLFENSWVGFYRSTLDDNKTYSTYQWSIKFEKQTNQDFSEDYDVFEYESSLVIGPGVQLRFLNDDGYTNEIAHTEPWQGVINPATVLHDELRRK